MAASPCLVLAIDLVQWSPLLVAGALVPPLAVFQFAKPTLGIALFAAQPTRWAVAGAMVLGLLGLWLVPSWPADWLHAAVTTNDYYVAPATVWRGGGPILLVAALAWRQREARLLLALSVTPHNMVLYDQLVLVAVSRRWTETLVLLVGSWVALVWGGAARSVAEGEFAQHVALRVPVVIGCYLPALLIVLKRGNVGELPVWLDRFVVNRLRPTRLPSGR